MALLQGSTYQLPIQIKACNGSIITGDEVAKAEFVFGDISKNYVNPQSEQVTSEVIWNSEKMAFIVPLTQEETFSLNKEVKWQARFQFRDGSVDGTLPGSVNVYDSISHTVFGED